MSACFCQGPARDALLAVARAHSPDGERQCRALLGLLVAGRRLRRSLRTELTRHDLTELGFHLLAHLEERAPAPVTGSELAERLNLSRASISAVLGRLEISRLITRTRLYDDRRTVGVTATDEGRRVFDRALRYHFAAVQRLMSAVPPGDIDGVLRASERLSRASDGETPDP